MDHAQEAIEAIDRRLAEPPVSIDEALDYAIENGSMSIKEAEQCREAYWRSFHDREHPITDDDTLASPIGYYENPPSLYG